MYKEFNVKNLEIKLKKLNKNAIAPTMATDGSAGFDLYSTGEYIIPPKETCLMPLGLSMAIPKGIVGLIYPRSGLALKRKLNLINGTGVIDSDYRGEIMVPLFNNGTETQVIKPNDRIAQICFMPYFIPEFTSVEELDDSERSAGGFGSTGV